MKFVATTAARVALVGVASSLLLAACGDTPKEEGVAEMVSTAAVEVMASPAGVEAIIAENTATVAIKDGKIEPKTVEALLGKPFTLVVTGDGTEHTLAIDTFVDGETVAATGDTEIQFDVDGAGGEYTITIDGKDAGTFTASEAGGA